MTLPRARAPRTGPPRPARRRPPLPGPHGLRPGGGAPAERTPAEAASGAPATAVGAPACTGTRRHARTGPRHPRVRVPDPAAGTGRQPGAVRDGSVTGKEHGR